MFGTQWGSLSAAATVIIAPIVVMTLILRRRIVSGMTSVQSSEAGRRCHLTPRQPPC